jgi:hypothetical protein
VGPEIYATQQGAELLEVYEGIINGKRRDFLLSLVKEAAAADTIDFPTWMREDPEAMKQKLAELGLNAWGEEKNDEGR